MDRHTTEGDESRVNRRDVLRGMVGLAAVPLLPHSKPLLSYVTEEECRQYYDSRSTLIAIRSSFVDYQFFDPLTETLEHRIEPIEPGTLITIEDGAGQSITVEVTQ